MFARRCDDPRYAQLTDTERELFYKNKTETFLMARVVGKCVVEPRQAAPLVQEVQQMVRHCSAMCERACFFSQC